MVFYQLHWHVLTADTNVWSYQLLYTDLLACSACAADCRAWGWAVHQQPALQSGNQQSPRQQQLQQYDWRAHTAWFRSTLQLARVLPPSGTPQQGLSSR